MTEKTWHRILALGREHGLPQLGIQLDVKPARNVPLDGLLLDTDDPCDPQLYINPLDFEAFVRRMHHFRTGGNPPV
jgi:hypothetical protein